MCSALTYDVMKSYLTPVWLFHTGNNTTFFPKPPTTFLICFRGERRKYAGKKVRLDQISDSQPLGHELDTLTTEPPGLGVYG